VDSVAFDSNFDLLAFGIEEEVVAHASLIPEALESAIFERPSVAIEIYSIGSADFDLL
jgi:hypothetical protein